MAVVCVAALVLIGWLHTRDVAQGWQPALAVMAALGGGLAGAYFCLAGRVRLAASQTHLARIGGGLYGLDLLGGALGALLPALLLPTVGLTWGLWLLAALNLCLPLTWLARRR